MPTGYSDIVRMVQHYNQHPQQQQPGSNPNASANPATPRANRDLTRAYDRRTPGSYLPPQIPGLDPVGALNGPTDVLSPADLSRLRARSIGTAEDRARGTIGNLGAAMGSTRGAAFRTAATRAATGANAGAAAANADVALQSSKMNSDNRNTRLDQIMRYVMGQQSLGQGAQRIDLEGMLGRIGATQRQQTVNQDVSDSQFRQWLERQQYMDAMMRQQGGGGQAGVAGGSY